MLAYFRTYQTAHGGSSCVSCPAGFYCAAGQLTLLGKDSFWGMPTVCPPGNYCPKGSQSPQQCPPGTYRSVKGAMAINECFVCPPGRYCSTRGIDVDDTEKLPECPAGYYCKLGAGTLWTGRENESSTILDEISTGGESRNEVEDPCQGKTPCKYALM